MREFTAQEVQKRLPEVQEAALLAPVAITHRGRRRHVMMSLSEFEGLQQMAEPRVYRTSEIPEDLLRHLAASPE